MENPQTWGEAEHVVYAALMEAEKLKAEGYVGYSKVQQITNTLREEGLLLDNAADARKAGFPTTAEWIKSLCEQINELKKELQDRELHHFETEQKLTQVEALPKQWQEDHDSGGNGKHGYHASEYGDVYAADLLAALAGGVAADAPTSSDGGQYRCPTSGEVESLTEGGFDICCDDPACPAYGKTRTTSTEAQSDDSAGG